MILFYGFGTSVDMSVACLVKKKRSIERVKQYAWLLYLSSFEADEDKKKTIITRTLSSEFNSSAERGFI